MGDPASASVTGDFAQVSLGKGGYQLTLTAVSGGPTQANVTIAQLGNLDTRTLPRVEGAADQYSSPSNSFYFTPVKVNEATAAVRRLFTAAGWQEYDRAFSQKADRPDRSDLLFRSKAYNLAVSISSRRTIRTRPLFNTTCQRSCTICPPRATPSMLKSRTRAGP